MVLRTRENQLGSLFLLPFNYLESRSLIDDGRKFIFTKRKNDFYSIQKNQLDNFKRITTQTNILFELLNQENVKTNK